MKSISDKMRASLFALFSFFAFSMYAQLANYDFNASADDQINGYDPDSIVGTPDFSSGEYVALDSGEYFILPEALSAAIDSTASLEILVRFKVEGDWRATEAMNGNGEEARVILSTKPEYDQRFEGFDITAREWESDLWILTTFGDGILDENGLQSEGKLDFVAKIDSGIWYDLSVKFVFDGDTPLIQYVVNGAPSVSYYDERVDYQGFQQQIQTRQFVVGSVVNNAVNSIHPSMDLSIDYLTIASPALPGDAAKVESALNALIDHMNGQTTWSSTQLDSIQEVFVANWDDLSYDANRSTVHTYMDTYSSTQGFVFTLQFNAEFPEDFDPLKAIQFQIQQWILDNQYSSETVANMAGLMFKEHERFPGSVSTSAERLQGGSFTIDGDYRTDPGFYLNDEDYVRRPTGYFVPAGELVTVTVPDAAIGQGLSLYVGAHRKNIQETWNELRRFPRVSTTFELDAKTITVANPFGGGLYVAIPDGHELGPLTFQMDGAVKAPYYCTKEGFATSLTEFTDAIARAEVPYVDMESANFMTTITHGMAAQMTDPDSVLSFWDGAFDAINVALGRPQKRFRSEYLIQDRQTHAKFTAAPAAYPMSLEVYAYPYEDAWQQPVDVESGRAWYNGPVSNTFNYVLFHEYGHLHNMPTLLFEQETNVHLPATAVYSLVMGESIDSAFVYALDQRLNLEQATFDWIFTSNFREGSRIGPEPSNEWDQLLYQSRGLVKIVDIAKMFGWEALGDIHKYFYEYRRDNPDWNPYGLQDDEYIRAASEVMGFNMAPHFEFHGILPSAELVEELKFMPTSDTIKERILHYRARVPVDNDAFTEIYDQVAPKISKEFHLPRWDEWKAAYNEGFAATVVGRIDTILSRYYDLTLEDLNVEPRITGLVQPLAIKENTSITLSLADLLVEDSDHEYPNDHTLIIREGENYTVDSLTITPTPDFVGTLSVSITVSDGIEESERFTATIEVDRVLALSPDVEPSVFYPNPAADGTVYVREVSVGSAYRVVDLAGKLHKKGVIGPEQKINIESKGFFLIEITTSQGEQIKGSVVVD
ncbi:MAG: M60 family peptidase N-terminal accessory domain-containing protein [Bacteroidota bacterium]